jgi:hypothetical protein
MFNIIRKISGKKEEMIAGEVTQTWGGIEWLVHGDLIGILQRCPQRAVHYRVGAFTEAMEHQYIRVDGVNDYYGAIDDASQKNYDNLRVLGEQFWKEFGEFVLKMLQSRIDELKQGIRRPVPDYNNNKNVTASVTTTTTSSAVGT